MLQLGQAHRERSKARYQSYRRDQPIHVRPPFTFHTSSADDFSRSNDTDAESELVIKAALAAGADAAVPCTLWAEGGLGAIELGKAVIQACSEPNPFRFLYDLDLPIKEKIEIIAREMYGAKDCSYTPEAEEQIATITKQGFSALPICMAKTHLSLSADPKAKGAPTGFTIPISVVKMSAGAGFIYPVRPSSLSPWHFADLVHVASSSVPCPPCLGCRLDQDSSTTNFSTTERSSDSRRLSQKNAHRYSALQHSSARIAFCILVDLWIIKRFNTILSFSHRSQRVTESSERVGRTQ